VGTPELGLIGKQERAASLHRKGGRDGAMAQRAPDAQRKLRSPGTFPFFSTQERPEEPGGRWAFRFHARCPRWEA